MVTNETIGEYIYLMLEYLIGQKQIELTIFFCFYHFITKQQNKTDKKMYYYKCVYEVMKMYVRRLEQLDT